MRESERKDNARAFYVALSKCNINSRLGSNACTVQNVASSFFVRHKLKELRLRSRAVSYTHLDVYKRQFVRSEK